MLDKTNENNHNHELSSLTTRKEILTMNKEQRQFKFEPKRDHHLRARGGTTQFYYLFCSQCGEYLALYQKDGPGSLLRLYLDRIFEPEHLALLQNETEKSKIPALICQKCNTPIGFPMVYEIGNRLAFRLVRGLFRKEKCEGFSYKQTQEKGESL